MNFQVFQILIFYTLKYDFKLNFNFNLKNTLLFLDRRLEIVENTKFKLGQDKETIAKKVKEKLKLSIFMAHYNYLNDNTLYEDFPNLTPGEVTTF